MNTGMRRFNAGLMVIVGIWGIAGSTASAQVYGGHYDWHPGHYDYHNGHYHWHRGHYDYHANSPRSVAPSTNWGVYPQINLYTPGSAYGPQPNYAVPQNNYVPNQGTYSLPQNSLVPQYGASVPATVYDGGPIVIACPADAPAPISYVLNGYTYTMKPGETQQFVNDRNWVVQFTRGIPGTADKRYTLSTGRYRFEPSSQGWDLNSDRASSTVTGQPAPPAPGAPIPLPGR